MAIIPADKLTRLDFEEKEYRKSERQYSDFPFDEELRKYLQELYKDFFYVDEGEDKLVRVRKLIAFGTKGIESIDLYMVGVYFQGDLSEESLKSIPDNVFLRLKYPNGKRPEDFLTQTAKYILSLTTWSHLIIENCPINLGFIKSSDYCSLMDSSLRSQLSFTGRKERNKNFRLIGSITIQRNYCFGDDKFGIMAGRSVFVEIPQADFLTSYGKNDWKANLAKKERTEKIAAAAAAAAAISTSPVISSVPVTSGAAATAVTDDSSGANPPVAGTSDDTTGTSSVAPTAAAISTSPVISSVPVTSAAAATAVTDDSSGANPPVAGTSDDTTGTSSVAPTAAAISTSPVISSVPVTSAAATAVTDDSSGANPPVAGTSDDTTGTSSVAPTDKSFLAPTDKSEVIGTNDITGAVEIAAANVVTTGTSLFLAPVESSVTADAAAAAAVIIAAATVVTTVGTSLLLVSSTPRSTDKPFLAPTDKSEVIGTDDITGAVEIAAATVVTTGGTSLLLVSSTPRSTGTDNITGDVEIAAALQKIYDDNEFFKTNIQKKRRDYRLEWLKSQKFKELDSRVLKNEGKLRTTRTIIDKMNEFSRSKIMPKGSQSYTDFNKAKDSLQTLIEEIDEDNLSIAEEKSTFLNNTFHANDLVPAIVFTATKTTSDKKRLKEHRAKTSANHEIDLQGNESIAFNGLNALVYNMQDSFILCLRSAYSGSKIEDDKITETYGKLSTFINNWLFLLKPSQQKKILNLFIEEGVNKNICDDCNKILFVLTTNTLLDMNEYVGADDNNQFKLELVLIWEANKLEFSITNKGETGTTTTKVTQAKT